jgi:hypothetical protein
MHQPLLIIGGIAVFVPFFPRLPAAADGAVHPVAAAARLGLVRMRPPLQGFFMSAWHLAPHPIMPCFDATRIARRPIAQPRLVMITFVWLIFHVTCSQARGMTARPSHVVDEQHGKLLSQWIQRGDSGQNRARDSGRLQSRLRAFGYEVRRRGLEFSIIRTFAQSRKMVGYEV